MLSKVSRTKRTGAVIVEVSVIFIVLLSMFFGTLEISRAMWTFHSFSRSIETAARYAALRGASCGGSQGDCPPSVGEMVERIRLSSRDLESERFAVTLVAGSQTVRCATLVDCATDPSYWPVWPSDVEGRKVTIKGEYTFDTLFFSLWHGDPRSGFKFRSEASEAVELEPRAGR